MKPAKKPQSMNLGRTWWALPLVILMVDAARVQTAAADATLFGGISLPLEEFAEEDDGFEGGGMAQTGFTGGLRLDMPLASPAVDWSSEFSLLYHPIDHDAVDDAYGGFLSDLEGGGYFIIPVLTGLRLQGKLAQGMELFATAQGGLRYLHQNELEGELLGAKGHMEFDNSLTPAFSVGVGLTITRQLELSAHYLYLGEADYTYDARGATGGQWVDGERRFDMQVWRFAIGYRL